MEITDVIVRILFAALAGGLVGLEREYRDKSAGFRTMILISVGASLFTVIAFSIAAEINDVDPTRIISYVISGIGFLGAGVIIKDGTSIKGLTTASAIWFSAALGMGAGAGFFVITSFAAAVILFVLVLLPPIEHWIDNRHEFRIYNIELKHKKNIAQVMALFEKNELSIFRKHFHKAKGLVKIDIYADGKPCKHTSTSTELLDDKDVIGF